MDIDVKKLILNAYEDLQKVTDPYQHGMLAVALVKAMNGNAVEIPAESKENLENAPKMKSKGKKKTLESATPAGAKVAQIMTDAANKTEEKAEAEEEKIELKPVDPPKAKEEAPKAEIPAAPATASDSTTDESYYDSEEWANKELTSAEFDDTWTDHMKKNKPLMESCKKLMQLVNGCTKNKDGSVNVNGTKWLDNAIVKVTSGNITSHEDKQLYMPKMVKTTYCALMMEYNALLKAYNTRKAA